MNTTKRLLERWWRPILFVAWIWALTGLLKNQRYTAFLRPEFGYVLGLGVFTLLGFLVTGMTESRSRHFGIPQVLHGLILLLPLAYLWNAQGASLDAYAFQKRYLGLPTVAVPGDDHESDTNSFKEDAAATGNPEPTVPRGIPKPSCPQESAADENRRKPERMAKGNPPLPTSTLESQFGHQSETLPKPAAVPPRMTIHIVKVGDTLYGLARKYYGDGKKWSAIADANQELLGGGTLITPGMELKVPPPDEAGLTEQTSDETTAARERERVQPSPVARSSMEQKTRERAEDTKPESEDAKTLVSAKSVTILDLYYMPAIYEGKRVKLIGMLHKNDPRVKKDFGRNMLIVFRFVITCCAADASPVALLVDGKDLPDLSENSWVEVEGTFNTKEKNGRRVAVLEKSSMKKTAQPRQPYLF